MLAQRSSHCTELTRTHEKIIGLLFQVIWEIPEELRRELSRLGSKWTLRSLRAQVNYASLPGCGSSSRVSSKTVSRALLFMVSKREHVAWLAIECLT